MCGDTGRDCKVCVGTQGPNRTLHASVDHVFKKALRIDLVVLVALTEKRREGHGGRREECGLWFKFVFLATPTVE